ncbi:hypothetical protein LXA43DRAFT_1140537 [Ganoderma leucocontextum]|nr:hypothetical protein LXA43DRAFT_1140537 [Ganoderma leucocontextum]
MPPQAALPATEHQAPPRNDAPGSAAGALEGLTLSMSPEESREECLKFPGGVTTSALSRDATTLKETARHNEALGGSLASTHRRLATDSSSVTTPTSTAPGAAGASIAKAPTEKKGKVTSTLEKRVTAKRGGTAGQKQKGKATERITASEYAKQKNAEVEERRLSGKTSNAKQFLEGKRIFYYGNDMSFPSKDTKRRMDLIVKHGGTLVPDYDPDHITHIVVHNKTSEDTLLKAIGLKRPTDIPQRIPTVTWEWVTTGFDAPRVRASTLSGKGKAPDRGGQGDVDASAEEDPLVYKMGWLFEYAVFSKRIDAGETPWGEFVSARKTHSAANGPSGSNARQSTDVFAPAETIDDISSISDFTQDKFSTGHGGQIAPYGCLPSPPASPSDPGLAIRQPLNSETSGKGPQAVHPPSGNGGPPTHTIFHAGSKAPGPTLNYDDEDPLAEFYAQARAERDAEMFGDDDSDTESIPSEKEQKQPTIARHGSREVFKKGVFLCDDKDGGGRLAVCPNQDVIDKLEELKELHDAKPTEDDRWRVHGLRKAISALRRYPTRIKSTEEARQLRGVGEKTARKIMEIIQTGGLMRIQYETTEDIKAIRVFTGIYGVGAMTARTWYNSGCKTLEDVAGRKGGVRLSYAQDIGLKYYTDINTRIPRTEVQEIYDKVRAAALKINSKLFIQVMGSFRRGKSTCGDIDVLITRPIDDSKTHQGVLRRLLAELHRKGVITEDLCLPDDFDDLELVYRGLCRRDSRSLRRRIDFLTVPWASRGAALLYYTGDDIFNRSLRLKARKMGYSLNQRGLYADVIRNSEGQKVTEGVLVASESEREIFDILGVPWQEPHERIRN